MHSYPRVPPARSGRPAHTMFGGVALSVLALLSLGAGTTSAASTAAGGKVLEVSPPEPTGTYLTALGTTVYTVGAGNTCNGALMVRRVPPTTLRTTTVATIQTPGSPCLGIGADSGGRAVAPADGSLFVLYSLAGGATLYRVTPSYRRGASLLKRPPAQAGPSALHALRRPSWP